MGPEVMTNYKESEALERKTLPVLGAEIDVVDYRSAIAAIQSWASRHESRYVCICNAHSIVTTVLDPEFFLVVNGASLATPDGSPVAWMMRQLGARSQERVNGPDLMWLYLKEAALRNESIYLYGSGEETLRQLRKVIADEMPSLKIAGMYSPPFRDLTDVEAESVVRNINASGACTVWVSLGCPKQEKWMAANQGKVNAVMIGVGAAFDYHAGIVKRAPRWMQQSGMEWFYRLVQEPKRLFKRYLVTNTLFVVCAIRQLLKK